MKKILITALVLAILAGIFALVARSRGEATTAPVYTAGTQSESITTADGRVRTYFIHIPAGYSADKTYPLVFLFHGGYGTGSEVLKNSNFAVKADAESLIVVAPNGIDRHWSDGNHDNTYDDVGFVKQLFAHLQTALPIDPSRVYAAGISNGGHFVERLGCELPDIFAAIAPDVAPLPQSILDRCTFSPMPVIGIQGGADPLAPVGGGDGKGQGGTLLSASATMQTFAKANSCNPAPALTHLSPAINDGTSVDQYTYTNCKADVIYYIVQGMGHGWPPSPPVSVRITGPTSQNINATDVIWNFFKAHPKP